MLTRYERNQLNRLIDDKDKLITMVKKLTEFIEYLIDTHIKDTIGKDIVYKKFLKLMVDFKNDREVK